jgi:beta-lactamase regulating signal transducer with metallopeptidase domain
MFAVRGIAVSFSIFFILYSALSLLVAALWQKASAGSQNWSARTCSDYLFVLRVAPCVLATGVTLILAVPSFLLLEPRSIKEPLGAPPIVLGFSGLAILVMGIWNAIAAWSRTSKAVEKWSSDARLIGCRQLSSKRPVSVLLTSVAAPPLAAAGILWPQVWLSRAAEFVLTERELQSALRHEMVHVQRRDNLRKLILRMVAFPGMDSLENAWREATEMAADAAAVSNCSEALDLAAAVIKLSRLVPFRVPAELSTALVHSPAESVNERVHRLISWTEPPTTPVRRTRLWYTLGASAAVLLTLIFTYGELLVRVHAVTEWLVG